MEFFQVMADMDMVKPHIINTCIQHWVVAVAVVEVVVVEVINIRVKILHWRCLH